MASAVILSPGVDVLQLLGTLGVSRARPLMSPCVFLSRTIHSSGDPVSTKDCPASQFWCMRSHVRCGSWLPLGVYGMTGSALGKMTSFGEAAVIGLDMEQIK